MVTHDKPVNDQPFHSPNYMEKEATRCRTKKTFHLTEVGVEEAPQRRHVSQGNGVWCWAGRVRTHFRRGTSMTEGGGARTCGEVRGCRAPWQREAAGVKRSIIKCEAEKGV